MTERIEWEELPVEFRDAVEARTGPVRASESVTSGFNCSLALDVRTRGSGRLFLKGVRTSDDAGMAGLLCEDRINRTVSGISPTVRHRFEAAGWLALAFIHIDGRHADYSPGAQDMGALTLTMRRMEGLRSPGFPIPQLWERFTAYLKPGEAEKLAGGHLLHTDTNPHNILIGHHDGTAYIIDWAMPVMGPSWVDPAYAAVWMMQYGHSPTDALAWLSGFPPWQRADPRAVEAFVAVTCRRWTDHMGETDAAASNECFHQLLNAIRST
ncbi:phosphotransferase [Streptomyces sp. NPDC020965]|uniref:phosphotransferase n=1 Tax=Streptomyces sp. NPDC020965 TaxID=3365105 RepID=UPI0037B4D1A4